VWWRRCSEMYAFVTIGWSVMIAKLGLLEVCDTAPCTHDRLAATSGLNAAALSARGCAAVAGT